MYPRLNIPNSSIIPQIYTKPYAYEVRHDPLKWTDWLGMFEAIIHRSEMSPSEKMTHLQQNVVGKAKSVIAGFRYNGNLYHQALKCLENRFGKPHIVIQAHLDKLLKVAPVAEDDAGSVTAFSTVINNICLDIPGSGLPR